MPLERAAVPPGAAVPWFRCGCAGTALDLAYKAKSRQRAASEVPDVAHPVLRCRRGVPSGSRKSLYLIGASQDPARHEIPMFPGGNFSGPSLRLGLG